MAVQWSHRKRLTHNDYYVAIFCPLEVEMSAVRYMLDETHQALANQEGDPNRYIYGQMSGHNVVVAFLPQGSQGIGAAANAATHMKRSFPQASLRLLVGIGGGVPSDQNDIRLGDVVISMPTGVHGGVVQYDLRKDKVTGIERKGVLEPPPVSWRTCVVEAQSDHRVDGNNISAHISEMVLSKPELKSYKRPTAVKDVLYLPNNIHVEDQLTCRKCDSSQVVERRERENNDPAIFYGLIASGNRVVKNAQVRDHIAKDAGGALCFETEAAGVMNDFGCVVIRGISDYADSHKNDDWHAYAAAVAAGCAKELLSYMPVRETFDRGTRLAQDFEKFSMSGAPGSLPKVLNYEGQDLKRQQISSIPSTSRSFDWVDDTPYSSWLTADDNGPMWLQGKPGTGKSTLVVHLAGSKKTIDRLNSRADRKFWTVLYFLFDYRAGISTANNLTGMLKSLLQQLSREKPSVAQELESYVDVLKADQQNDHLDCLCNIVKRNQLNVITFLDGLDELEGDKGQLCKVVEDLQTRAGMKICLASRPEEALRAGLSNMSCTVIEVQKYNNEGVVACVNYKAHKLKAANYKLVATLTGPLLDLIVRRADGVILWASLVLDEVARAIDQAPSSEPADLRRMVEKLPREVSDVYERILDRIPLSERTQVALILQLVKQFEALPSDVGYMTVSLLNQSTFYVNPSTLGRVSDATFEAYIRGLLGHLLDIYDQRSLVAGTGRISRLSYRIEARGFDSFTYAHRGTLLVRLIHKSLATYLDQQKWVTQHLSILDYKHGCFNWNDIATSFILDIETKLDPQAALLEAELQKSASTVLYTLDLPQSYFEPYPVLAGFLLLDIWSGGARSRIGEHYEVQSRYPPEANKTALVHLVCCQICRMTLFMAPGICHDVLRLYETGRLWLLMRMVHSRIDVWKNEIAENQDILQQTEMRSILKIFTRVSSCAEDAGRTDVEELARDMLINFLQVFAQKGAYVHAQQICLSLDNYHYSRAAFDPLYYGLRLQPFKLDLLTHDVYCTWSEKDRTVVHHWLRMGGCRLKPLSIDEEVKWLRLFNEQSVHIDSLFAAEGGILNAIIDFGRRCWFYNQKGHISSEKAGRRLSRKFAAAAQVGFVPQSESNATKVMRRSYEKKIRFQKLTGLKHYHSPFCRMVTLGERAIKQYHRNGAWGDCLKDVTEALENRSSRWERDEARYIYKPSFFSDTTQVSLSMNESRGSRLPYTIKNGFIIDRLPKDSV